MTPGDIQAALVFTAIGAVVGLCIAAFLTGAHTGAQTTQKHGTTEVNADPSGQARSVSKSSAEPPK